MSVYNDDDIVDDMPRTPNAYDESAIAEIITEDHQNLEEGDVMVSFCHFEIESRTWITMDTVTFHGQPFFFIFKKDETLGEARTRIRKQIGISEHLFKEWSIYSMRNSSRDILEDDFVPSLVDYNNEIIYG
eukprot:CAMPEP_0168525106 /NCGR_PEP_ID=MMETSP0405-20121227/11098_1 /TAXON_ID=498012 /ORGANISM="Trichosphaerium sp, Strain Am-I-7 wt" /LENGTH=130 /DNA_ID=CAMNT_0008547541 /DNA_START=121 /DNA_END=509 /DNA_ORIENTATION=-